MYDLAKNIRFRKTGNIFQQHLNEDIKSIKQSESFYVPADKTTTNIYKVKPDDYNKLLNDNITAVYKRTDKNVVFELVGLFFLDRLASVLGKENVGLYRDDGLSMLRNNSGPAIERTRKKITRVFQAQGLRITSECNLSRTYF